jgi:hypothetical protein
VLSPSARYAVAAIPVGLATVFVPDHSPRALIVFLLAHSVFGILLLAFSGAHRDWVPRNFGFLVGLITGSGALIVLILDSSAADLASLAAIIWSVAWIIHWFLNRPTATRQFLAPRDLMIQLAAAGMLILALALSFGDPIASTGFAGVYLVISGFHLGIVAASPRVG